MTTIFAIDPGNIESGYAVIEMPNFRLVNFGKVENGELLQLLETIGKGVSDPPYFFVIEKIQNLGMPVGADVFETCYWIGQFQHALKYQLLDFVYRKDEKITLCGTMKAKDANIRQELINRYAKFDFKNGKCPWACKFKPVEGWKAEPTKIRCRDHETGYIDSFDVYECPLFQLAEAIKKGIVERVNHRRKGE